MVASGRRRRVFLILVLLVVLSLIARHCGSGHEPVHNYECPTGSNCGPETVTGSDSGLARTRDGDAR
jgi:hypothetical protein